MQRASRAEWTLLTTPLVVFLLVLLGFPAVVDIIYSISEISFQTLRSPKITGFGNFIAVVNDPAFWKASWFSLRFGVLTALIECLAGLGQ